MSDDPSTENPDTPVEGGLLPHAAEAFGVRRKLETYSLDANHKSGGPKARGFEHILGITIEAIDYLEAQIMARILDIPISEIRDNAPYGVNCVVVMPIHGIGAKADRVAQVLTSWEVKDTSTPPRLVTAYPTT